MAERLGFFWADSTHTSGTPLARCRRPWPGDSSFLWCGPEGPALVGWSAFALVRVLDDLVQALTVDVGFDLHPDGEMIGKLEAEFLACVVFGRE